MKRVSILLVWVTLGMAVAVRAGDAATEERLNKLAGQIEDLRAGQEALRKQIDSIAREVDSLRDQVAKPTGNYAAVEDLNRLRDAIKDVDQKRLADAEKTSKELARLGSLLAAGASRRSAAAPPSDRATKDAPKAQEKGFGDYTIQSGDTLSLIVQAYRQKGIKLTTEQIIKANPGLEPRKLQPGQKIWIPAPQ